MQTTPLNPALSDHLNTLQQVINDPAINAKVNAAFTAAKGDWTATINSLKTSNVDAATIGKIDFTHLLANATQNNIDLSKSIMAQPGISSMRDVALNYNATAIAAMITPAEVPPGTAGETPQEMVNNFAKSIINNVYLQEPTAVLQGMVKRDELLISGTKVNTGVLTVLDNLNTFKIGTASIATTSVYTALQHESALNGVNDQDKATVINQLKTIQRVNAISPSPAAIQTLLGAGIGSANQVTAKSETSFMNSFVPLLGQDEASAVYYHATNVKLRNENAIVNMKQTVNGTGISIIDGPVVIDGGLNLVNAAAAKQGVQIGWEALFGLTDLCQCGDCNSVYSPAAYFVELLQYLRNNDLDTTDPGYTTPSGQAINTDPTSISGTVLEKFFARRPDLALLELSCANTNTVLPYIDLVNEVLESYVAYLNVTQIIDTQQYVYPDVISVFNTEDETTGELLAQPQHTNYHTYPILADAVYPFTLPYNQAVDTIRIFLNFLGTSLYEVMETFAVSGVADSSGDTTIPTPIDPNIIAQLIPLNEKALARATEAEYLGLTAIEYINLVKEDYWQKTFYDTKKGVALTTDAYEKLIGLKDVWEYYGYAPGAGGENDMLAKGVKPTDGLTYVEDQFLRRTGIQYTDLVNILQTRYINPSQPSGDAVTLYHVLLPHFKFLISKADNTSVDPKGKFATVFLWIDSFNKSGIINIDKNIPVTIPFFDAYSGVIVLDTGDTPYLPIEGNLYNASDSSDTLLGTLNNAGTITGPDKKQIGHVNENSKVIADTSVLAGIPVMSIKNGDTLVGFIVDGTIVSMYSQSNTVTKDDSLDFANNTVTWQPPLESCDLSKVTLVHLDGSPLTTPEYDKLQLFIRLWLKLGWTIDETDKAIAGLGNSITADLVHQLVAVQKLAATTGLDLIKLLTFWSDISTIGDASQPGSPSLYSTLFLSYNMVNLDDIFKAASDGSYPKAPALITDHLPVIMAALNLQAQDITNILAYPPTTSNALTVANVSVLYRNSLLMQQLGVTSYQLQQIIQLLGDPFTSADVTATFLTTWGNMADAGFTYNQLNYVINGIDDKNIPLSPPKVAMLQLAKTLYDGLTQIDSDNADLTDSTAATADFVTTKVALLYTADVAAQVMAFLLGTTIYTSGAPTALVSNPGDFTSMIANSTLAPKLKYDYTNGSIQVTGILTNDEIAAAKALFSGNADWALAFDTVAAQALSFYNNVLAMVIKGLPAAQQPITQGLLLQGDTNISASQQTVIPPIPLTSTVKLFNFITAFLPYLRNQLETKLLITTLSGQAGIGSDVAEVLLAEVLTAGTPAVPLLETFRGIKDRQPAPLSYTGYLVPNAEDNYQFIITKSSFTATLKINGQNISFTQQVNPDNVWLSDFIKLKTGYAYYIEITGLSAGLTELTWKTGLTIPAAIPQSVLYPDDSTTAVTKAFIQLQKAAIIASGFSFTAGEISYLQKNGTDFDGLDFNNFTLPNWQDCYSYILFRNSLPKTDTDLISFFTWVNNPDDVTLLDTKISQLTLWQPADITTLCAAGNFNLAISNFKNATSLLRLQQAIYLATKISMDVSKLLTWVVPESNFFASKAVADSIIKATKARYAETDWEQVAEPLYDKLRENQRDALIGYLLAQGALSGVTDANGLFEYFLIDVQMDSCMQTSRIKQAINSVQLYVQRCFLGLEDGIANNTLDVGQWQWLQREVLWVANRKVFLYPENWIDETLRDDKSDFFTELQSELLQKDINTQTVEAALKNYLYKLNEVANMMVVGLYVDDANPKTGSSYIYVFSRTRTAPYFFYYCYYKPDEQNWVAWEKVQVDIPSYDVENNDGSTQHGQITGNGCYLVPVVFDNRLLIFFPQFVKKNSPGDNSNTFSAKESITINKPNEYWEVKMAWSEYRNNKWTQKQVSTDAVYCMNMFATTDTKSKKTTGKHKASTSNVIKDIGEIISIPTLPSDTTIKVTTTATAIDKFMFVPVITADNVLEINVVDVNKAALIEHSEGCFKFEGSHLSVTIKDKNLDVEDLTDSFSYFTSNGTIFSYQEKPQKGQSNYLPYHSGSYPFVIDKKNSVQIEVVAGTTNKFYHPYTHQLLGRTGTGNLVDFFECAPNVPPVMISTLHATTVNDHGDMFGAIKIDESPIYDELAAPYSLYNWELFFHTPMMLAGSLSAAQNFDLAITYYEYVFNPKIKGKTGSDYWRFWPFHHTTASNYLENLFYSLQPNTPNNQISTWRNKPFNPHAIARLRPVAYMKWTVMKYLDNLIAYGDYLFTQHTIESINQATQLYVYAYHIIGQRQQVIPQEGVIKAESYHSLLGKWDAFGNAMVEMEVIFPYKVDDPIPSNFNNSRVGHANIYGTATTSYFCTPDNPNLTAYWDILDDRLSKIRQCENIDGVFGLPPLWDPPIDPGLLVQAAADGISFANILNDMSTPVPNYRFNYLMQKSLELCNELKSMGNSLLSALEKGDAEHLANMRARHETTINTMVMQVKTMQLDEANKSLDSLKQNLAGPKYRLEHYLKLLGADLGAVPKDTSTDFTEIPDVIGVPVNDSGLILIASEKEEMDQAASAQDWQLAIGANEVLVSILNTIPNFSVNAEPFGIGASVSFGGSNLGASQEAITKGLQVYAGDLSYQSANAQRTSGFLRQMQDRVLQANNAGYEINSINRQITTQEIRVKIADQEIKNQQKQIDNANEVQTFLTNKFTNEDLYSWMWKSIQNLYYKVYTLAYSLAKKAELVYRFDRGLSTSSFIKFGYWDAGHYGLLAGEQLYVSLKQLETAYQQDQGYDFEITKHISLRQINPIALFALRVNGSCTFEVPEILFDMDFPGHYMRRIKSVALSIPCITGPYAGVNATLQLTQNKFRQSSIAANAKAYPEVVGQDETRFVTTNVPISSIAVSSGQNDSGVFELNFKDERYMPFEGAGAISNWLLELPADFRQFDYKTITDVIMHLRYTSVNGGDSLKTNAAGALKTYIGNIQTLSQQEGLFLLVDVQNDFPNDWYKATQMPLATGATSRIIQLNNLVDRLPVFTKGYSKITAVNILLYTSAGLAAGVLMLTTQEKHTINFSPGINIGSFNSFVNINSIQENIDNWIITINDVQTDLNDLWMIVRYELS